MKIKVFRTSGNPVNPKDAKSYQEEWQNGFDKIWEDDTKRMEEKQKLIDDFENELKNKYNDLTVVEWKLPKTGKAWKDLLSDYGNIMVTTNVENEELLLVINDMPF